MSSSYIKQWIGELSIDQYCKTKDGKVFACFVDFQIAFDKVIHTGIKLKLLGIKVSSRFYNIIKTCRAIVHLSLC
jgi:hypothetical protein